MLLMVEDAAEFRSIAIIIVAFIFYWLPTFAAFSRNHRSRSAIAITNFFLGWTVLGWIIALIWSYTGDVEPEVAPNPPPLLRNEERPANFCPGCGKPLLSSDLFCRGCGRAAATAVATSAP